MLFRIGWVSQRYGTSQVEANSYVEAKEAAINGEDTGFEELDDTFPDWEIDNIELIPEEG